MSKTTSHARPTSDASVLSMSSATTGRVSKKQRLTPAEQEAALITALNVSGLDIKQNLNQSHEAPSQAAVVTALNQVPLTKLLADSQEKLTHGLAVDLAFVWAEFDKKIINLPIIRRFEKGMVTKEDYKNLLLMWGQLLMHGGRWLARAAGSSASTELFPIRSILVDYAAQEQQDFKRIQNDYAAMGGDINDLRAEIKNIGCEALSSYMFHQASQPDPLQILGVIFITENLFSLKPTSWVNQLKEKLGLEDHQLSFLNAYSKNADLNHTKLRTMLSASYITAEAAKKIAYAARVTGRLYGMALEEVPMAVIATGQLYRERTKVFSLANRG